MKTSLRFTSAFLFAAALTPFVIPAVTAAPPAQAPAQVKTLDTKTFNAKINEIQKLAQTDAAKGVDAWFAFLKSEKLEAWQTNQVSQRIVDFSMRSGDAGRIAAAIALARENGASNLLGQTIRLLAGVKKDPYRGDVEALLPLLLKNADRDRANQLRFTVRDLSRINPEYFALAEKTLAAARNELNAEQLLDIYSTFVLNAFNLKLAPDVVEKYWTALLETAIEQKNAIAADLKAVEAELKANPKSKAKPNQNLERNFARTGDQIVRVLNEARAKQFPDMGKMFASAKSLNLLSPDRVTEFEIGGGMVAALAKNDMTAYRALEVKFLALPFGETRTRCLESIARGVRGNSHVLPALYEAELKNPEIAPARAFDLRSRMRSFAGPLSYYQGGFPEPRAYPVWKKLTLELLELDRKNDGKLAKADFCMSNAEVANTHGDFAFAEEQARRAFALSSRPGWKHPRLTDLAASLALRSNNMKWFDEIVAVTTDAEQQKTFAAAKQYLTDGKKVLTANFGLADQVQALRLKRAVSELLFRSGRFDLCQEIGSQVVKDMFISFAPLSCEVTYMENPPRSADGFTRTPMFNDWNAMETRFEPYGAVPAISAQTDETRLLTSAKKQEIDPAWKTGLRFVCDQDGLHIYVRCLDPGVREVVLGKRDGGTLECTFRPADETVYNMWFFTNLPKTDDPHGLDFASPTPRYRKTTDFFLKDACFTQDGMVAHTYIPWVTFYDNLPFDGKIWHYGMQRWCKGGGQTISGQTHEMARMLQLKFKFTPEQVRTIKRNVCAAMFFRYKNSKTLPVWKNDDELGDPAFYEAMLAPLVKELDEAGARLDDEKADIDALFRDYAPRWAEFEYTIAEKRREYLKKKIFK